MSNQTDPPLCLHCGQPAVKAELGKLPGVTPFEAANRANQPVWACLPCDARVGCHRFNPAAGIHSRWVAMGRPINKKGAAMRAEAHKVIDPIWQNAPRSVRNQTRDSLYAYLTYELKLEDEFHIGNMTANGCRRAIVAAYKLQGRAATAKMSIDKYLRVYVLDHIIPKRK